MGVTLLTLPQCWVLIQKSIMAWLADYAPSMGAALSYYTVFSLAPTLLIVISVAGLVFGAEAVRGEIFGQLSYLMGPAARKAIAAGAGQRAPADAGLTGTIVGVALLLAGATSVFGELQNALDRIWRASARESARASAA